MERRATSKLIARSAVRHAGSTPGGGGELEEGMRKGGMRGAGRHRLGLTRQQVLGLGFRV
jgi:hypothetical protein